MRLPRRLFPWRAPAILGALLLLAAMTASCAWYQAPVKPPNGLLFTNVKAPLTVHYDNTPVGREAKMYSRRSTKFFQDFLLTGLSFGWDDAAIHQIVREGQIEEVAYADYEALCILGIYAEFTVELYGN